MLSRAQKLWCMGLVAPCHVESSRTRDQTVPGIGRRILDHWTTREVLQALLHGCPGQQGASGGLRPKPTKSISNQRREGPFLPTEGPCCGSCSKQTTCPSSYQPWRPVDMAWVRARLASPRKPRTLERETAETACCWSLTCPGLGPHGLCRTLEGKNCGSSFFLLVPGPKRSTYLGSTGVSQHLSSKWMCVRPNGRGVGQRFL